MRKSNESDTKGPFLYSDPIKNPEIENTDLLFGLKRATTSNPTTRAAVPAK